jgi:hypothetical protein
LPKLLGFAADALQDSRCGAARVCHDRGAAGSRPAPGTPSAKRPVGTRRAASIAACRTRCPKEPHAQRSWHLQRSPPVQSEDLPPEVWLAESLRRRAARPTPCNHAYSSTSRPTPCNHAYSSTSRRNASKRVLLGRENERGGGHTRYSSWMALGPRDRRSKASVWAPSVVAFAADIDG